MITKVISTFGSIYTLMVTAENKGNSVAFMVHPRVTRGKGVEDITPIFWSDNYFSLLPGEKKTVRARFDFTSQDGLPPELVVDGWNLDPVIP